MIKISRMQWAVSLLFTLGLSSLAGCNVFSIVDSPSGDEQVLSAARACFDEGDFECARKQYASLSNDYSDIRASEEAFLILAENGLNMGAFMETFGNGGNGAALTALAEKLAPGSETKRKKIQEAYAKHTLITQNASLKALVRFIGSIALTAEFLAEELAAGEKLTKARIAGGGQNCPLDNTCATNAACSEPTGAKLKNGVTGLSLDLAAAPLTGSIDLGHFQRGMVEVRQALAALSSSGKFSAGSGEMAEDIESQNLGAANDSVYQCFRSQLLKTGIGR